MKRFISIMFLSLLFLGNQAVADSSPYKFSYKGKNDMRGAWFLCAPVGFTLGDCPKVLEKCWLPPMLRVKCHKFHCHVKSHCTKLPKFSWSDGDTDKALAEARRRAGLNSSYNNQPIVDHKH